MSLILYFTRFLTNEADKAPEGTSDIFNAANSVGLDEILLNFPIFGLSKIRPSTEFTLSHLKKKSVTLSRIFFLSSPITINKFKSGMSRFSPIILYKGVNGVALGTSGTHILSTSISFIFFFISSSFSLDIICSLTAFTIVFVMSSALPNTLIFSEQGIGFSLLSFVLERIT